MLEPDAPWAGNTFFCWNQPLFLLEPSFFCYYGHWTLFSVRLFCWNRLIHLLQLAYRFLLLRFLLAPPLSFVGTGNLFASTKYQRFLLHSIFAGNSIKFCWNQLIFLLQPFIGGFCCFLDLFLLDMAVAVQVNDGGRRRRRPRCCNHGDHMLEPVCVQATTMSSGGS